MNYMEIYARVTIHNNQTDEKHKGCNLRLNTATEHEETMSLGNVFQMLTIRSEKKLASQTDVVRCKSNCNLQKPEQVTVCSGQY